MGHPGVSLDDEPEKASSGLVTGFSCTIGFTFTILQPMSSPAAVVQDRLIQVWEEANSWRLWLCTVRLLNMRYFHLPIAASPLSKISLPYSEFVPRSKLTSCPPIHGGELNRGIKAAIIYLGPHGSGSVFRVVRVFTTINNCTMHSADRTRRSRPFPKSSPGSCSQTQRPTLEQLRDP